MTAADQWRLKLDQLKGILQNMGSVLVAYSGGVDSTLLAELARQALGERALAVTATSPTYAARELAEARSVAAACGFRHLIIASNELHIPGFAENSPKRCYLCKAHLFGQLVVLAGEHGLACVIDGSNCDDEADYRPGRQAALEYDVRSPLQEAGFTKHDIRAASKAMGLPTAERPAAACLASRFPYGTTITMENLGQVEAMEAFLHDHGFHSCRARYHGSVIRLELDAAGLVRLLAPGLRQSCVNHAKGLGFTYVTLDLEGYRTGSANEMLGQVVQKSTMD